MPSTRGDAHEQHQVVAIPARDVLVVGEAPPERGRRGVAAVLEAPHPVLVLLFVDVTAPTLPGRGGGEQHAVGQRDEVVDEAVGTTGGEMLGDLEAHGEVEPRAAG